MGCNQVRSRQLLDRIRVCLPFLDEMVIVEDDTLVQILISQSPITSAVVQVPAPLAVIHFDTRVADNHGEDSGNLDTVFMVCAR